jgi:hypothetical protein
MWICPRCGRQFKQATREHSCELRTVEAHLAGKPAATVALYRAFEAALLACGPLSIEPLKTMICYKRSKNVFGVALRKDYLRFSMLLAAGTSSPRFKASDAYSKGTSHVVMELHSISEIDAELRAWLQAAYELAE